MKLFFVRHGKTQWNLEGRFQGAGGDSPLLEDSYEEMKVLGHYLQSVSFDAIFSSDLKRAQQTAQEIAKHSQQKTEIVYTQALREWKLGKLEGAKIATMSSIYPSQMAAFRQNLAKFHATQFEAESIYQTTQRVRDFITSFASKGYENVLLVGHGANLTASIRSLLGYEAAQLRALGGLDNLSLTILETNDCQTFKCLSWNDKSYLQKEDSY
ncbi:histidine phosphatase family protein [Streptococcus didelphis]|uniref:histidine phosphatase family protein n=1 Tax=Streptococcus didelphis TaxID=102886 RepID=UPI00037BAFF6|nr:histidine phosphatase family protein [Streptococcus didelphis]